MRFVWLGLCSGAVRRIRKLWSCHLEICGTCNSHSRVWHKDGDLIWFEKRSCLCFWKHGNHISCLETRAPWRFHLVSMRCRRLNQLQIRSGAATGTKHWVKVRRLGRDNYWARCDPPWLEFWWKKGRGAEKHGVFLCGTMSFPTSCRVEGGRACSQRLKRRRELANLRIEGLKFHISPILKNWKLPQCEIVDLSTIGQRRRRAVMTIDGLEHVFSIPD